MQSGVFAMAAPKESKPVETKASTATKNIKPKVPQVKLQAPSGDRYEATVPDTLDLAHRAELALKGLANVADPKDGYMQWFYLHWGHNPPYMRHAYNDIDCTSKLWDCFAKLRVMCGSEQFLDVEQGMENTLLSFLDKDDGLLYAKYDPKRPWIYDNEYTNYPGQKIVKEDYGLPNASALMLNPMVLRNELGVTSCEEQIRAMVRGLDNAAIKKDDYAYFPGGGKGAMVCGRPRSGWKDTTEPGSPGDKAGVEEGLFITWMRSIRGLSLWADRSGDEQALELAGKLTRLVMRSKNQWGNPADPPYVISVEKGHFDRHLAAYTHVHRALLEYALVAGDNRICDFVRSSYEYLRSYGINRLGYMPYHNAWPAMDESGCLLSDLVFLSIKMSRAGMGDYWDDADRVIRNHLVETQFLRKDLMARALNTPGKPIPKSHPGQICRDNVHERMIGTFANHVKADYIDPGREEVLQCCTGNGPRGLAYAWDGILDCKNDDEVQVNLLLNRASKWADVDSYLPYEGKVIIHNKTARQISVRIPQWVDRSKLKASINGTARNLSWVAAYVVFGDMKPGDTLQLDFPVLEETVHLTARTALKGDNQYTTYEITSRGNTVVDISPRTKDPRAYPIYLRDHMKTGKKAPMKTKIRFAPDKTFRW